MRIFHERKFGPMSQNPRIEQERGLFGHVYIEVGHSRLWKWIIWLAGLSWQEILHPRFAVITCDPVTYDSYRDAKT
jgi:hypothetical protein